MKKIKYLFQTKTEFDWNKIHRLFYPISWFTDLAYQWIQIACVSCQFVFVCDTYVLCAPAVHHHVPGISIQTISPIVITLHKEREK